jgi:hypothetical protein
MDRAKTSKPAHAGTCFGTTGEMVMAQVFPQKASTIVLTVGLTRNVHKSLTTNQAVYPGLSLLFIVNK